jgi:hypothetical protein
MAKLTLGEKASRVLKMLIGLRNARVAAAMAAYGFSDTDLQEGWHLLQSVSRVKLDAASMSASNDTIEKLDAWENQSSSIIWWAAPASLASMCHARSNASSPVSKALAPKRARNRCIQVLGSIASETSTGCIAVARTTAVPSVIA